MDVLSKHHTVLSHKKFSEDTAFLFTKKKKSDFTQLQMLEEGGETAVHTAISYGLDSAWFESQWGARFSAPIQASPGAHPASCIVSTGSLF